MAEAVGLLGTAVGVASFSIQLCEGLKKYLSDYKSRDEQVSKALSHLEHLRQSLEVIRSITPSFTNEHQEAVKSVTSSLQISQDELEVLHSSFRENETSTPTDLKGRIKETKKRMAFPFRKFDLDKLESDLERNSRNLSIAVEALGL